MEGVQVLNQFEYWLSEDRFYIVLIAIVFAIIIAVINFFEKCIKIAVIATIVVLLGGYSLYTFNDDYVTRIEAIVDKSVSYIELTEKYKIIDQRGDIWVLEEKEPNETSLLSGGEDK